jgi:Tfp pilus assembly protein PilF
LTDAPRSDPPFNSPIVQPPPVDEGAKTRSGAPAGAQRVRNTVARPQPVSHQPPAVAGPEASLKRSTPPNDLDLALYYHRAGDFENALQYYRALLRGNELNAQAHNNLGLLYQERNLLDESARELQRALIIEPNNAGTRNNYGVTLLKQGHVDEALGEFTTASRLAPRSVDPLVNMALARRDAGQPEAATETLVRALALDPRNAAAHYNLAQLYDQANETAPAVEHYRKFLEAAGAEYASRAGAVRNRIDALTRHSN